MAVDETMKMDHELVRSAAMDMADMAVALQSVQTYATGDGLKAEHFGGTPEGFNAFGSFNGVVQALAQSVTKAQQFCTEAAKRIDASAKSTTATDVDNAWGLTQSGGK
ncbi:hypothetical protein V5P93_006774 [Actinokineospora auranticolor]|uniref:Excreted virulence factor EspC (Type VII ESX diderm) n=1 Tax=Actinokineospora auranticolor TaxID=155976 RepID=A0A2S6GWQ0_9PSEU|nr:hypothetical protein [Actinokineospora auranticolor]PPK69581.1 hypothetical protein CLV40_103191 [Actinokineospora auranticolor]